MSDIFSYIIGVEVPERLELSIEDIDETLEDGEPTMLQTKELKEIKSELKNLIKRLKKIAY